MSLVCVSTLAGLSVLCVGFGFPAHAAERKTQRLFPPPVRAAAAAIAAERLLQHTRVLAGDDFEGRAPASAGEEKTVAYLVEQFQALGLAPGNPDGTWVQPVPLVGSTALDVASSYRVGDRTVALAFPGECVVWTKRFVPEIRVEDSEMVFVGYGVVAPEYGWDDFKDVEVRGKTLVMLINDPPVGLEAEPERLDPRYFKGRAMTYYGRWTYKFEMAAAKGAAAALIVHEQGPAGYPWFVVVGSNSRENFDLQSAHRNLERSAIEGWITLEQARRLFAARGLDFETLKRRAARKDFRPVPLDVRASFSLKNQMREVTSRNVLARLEGSHPRDRRECVVFSSHWDHLGRAPGLEGDDIYNGALDNASGIGVLLELARAYASLRPAPRRSLLLLAVTAEEKGLLGARYYAEHPLVPLERTVANLNIDGINPWGRTRDVEVIGHGNSTLEDTLEQVATLQDRRVIADSEPEKGRFYRSDHFEFAKVGVPALYVKGGIDFPGKPENYGLRKMDEYTTRDYHKVSDEVKPDWDLSGAVLDTQLLFYVGWQVAQDEAWPAWKPDSEFRARRQAMLEAADTRRP